MSTGLRVVCQSSHAHGAMRIDSPVEDAAVELPYQRQPVVDVHVDRYGRATASLCGKYLGKPPKCLTKRCSELRATLHSAL